MFAGHFAVAAAAKARTPHVPLWAMVLSTQLLDIVFVPLLLLGIETIEPINGGGYGQNVIHADFTHSLVGAGVVSAAAALWAGRLWGRRSAWTIGALTFSHWLLDVVVHRGDMALFPGASRGLPVGLGLWESPLVSIALEAALIVTGYVWYRRSVLLAAPRGKRQTWGRAASAAMGVLLVLALVTDVLGVS